MELTQEELNERVALLKKFRGLLEQQRAKFQEYLTVLEKQQDSISTENTDALLAHTELEQQIEKARDIDERMRKLRERRTGGRTSADDGTDAG